MSTRSLASEMPMRVFEVPGRNLLGEVRLHVTWNLGAQRLKVFSEHRAHHERCGDQVEEELGRLRETETLYLKEKYGA